MLEMLPHPYHHYSLPEWLFLGLSVVVYCIGAYHVLKWTWERVGLPPLVWFLFSRYGVPPSVMSRWEREIRNRL